MNKKIHLLILLIFISFTVFAQNGRIKFLKGNIIEKIDAVKEANEEDSIWLTNKAISFCVENIDELKNDRDLDVLATAAIYSISNNYVKYATESQKNTLITQLIELFTKYEKSPNVQIAVLTKIVSLQSFLNTQDFTLLLNNYITSININVVDYGVFKSLLNTLEQIGNNNTFVILYSLLNNSHYEKYKSEIEKTTVALLPSAMNEVLSLIQQANLKQMNEIFTLLTKNSSFSTNSRCEISENMLSKSILIIENSSKVTAEYLTIPSAMLKILSENKWTRASSKALSYFQITKNLCYSGVMSETEFCDVIYSLSNISPIESVIPLITFLEELNGLLEEGTIVSQEIVLAVIKTLGAIGDKAAFDSLLAVTYLNYPEPILQASQEALSGLRW